ncbi:hypothetical protein KOAAANKH_03652 [Brevundimonas sp. NIBR10]|uniref:hypothetical protein n=1 Tax=Brevundimonas sp. NIBR10 TaxID=3015997 RepID=UPI0022F16243|nr:hypothetical protein [Brevundimonas sp. NIBR10]WGM48745.1 hypothetical protein KOAAANKH_03652 [Brevundimonas sp. NIBR10]
MALLWLVSAVTIGPISWIIAPASALAHYGLSVAGLFATFAVVYFILERARLRFSRVGAWVHFGLMTLGTVLITGPYFVLNTIPVPTAGPEMIALYRTLSTITTFGYGFSLLGLAVFIGALVHTAWIAVRTRT